MSCNGNLSRKDLIMGEKIDIEDEACNNKHDGPGKMEGCNDHHRRTGLRSDTNKDMFQTLDMFKKYLFSKASQRNNNLGRTNLEESEVIRTSSSRMLPLPKLGFNMSRPPSLLERELLPGIGYNPTKPSSETKTATAQLTIFYAGAINVYDNVPVDKAHVIMLLAGESSSSKPMTLEMPKIDAEKPLSGGNLASIYKLEADLPLARKLSLQHFLEKRRLRLTNKHPYCRPEMEIKEKH